MSPPAHSPGKRATKEMKSAKFLITKREKARREEAWLWQRGEKTQNKEKHCKQLQGSCRSNLWCQAVEVKLE